MEAKSHPASSQRIARARALAGRYPAAAEILTFYAQLAAYQRTLLDQAPGPAIDREQLVAAIPSFLAWLEREAPATLAASATDLRRLTSADWRDRFDRACAEAPEQSGTDDDIAMFVVEALLQPVAERNAATNPRTDEPRAQSREPRAERRCPACGGLPLVGVLREEGHGARRALVCARCATEWPFERVCCPGCGERQFETLPVYTAEPFGHIRVEACDLCRRYLKTVDLTKDGLAVAQVDDLASLPLDLWARGEGYVRVRANLLRT